ncbi:hypothetical protein ABMA70_06495 [Halobacteriovorax sp. XZX-3]|uniref:hypothetical protein n=1 Tax=unclassified Halobacteriovorax TaxID=2639665 RepID=UPI000CD17977|nr:hypothetical protein [Halobacteriovorax sp. DA5]POB14857.1 hypothetical protein C0Z22_00355 [Halobacteriovorax sp. DA5]
MRNDFNLVHSENANGNAEEIELTNSFPYMLLIASMAVITIMHLILYPLAKQFAARFIGY